MIHSFGWHSVRHKLLAGVLLTTVAAVMFFGIAIMVYDRFDYRERLVNDLSTQSELLGRTSAAALKFDDPVVAQNNLALLQARPQILAAAIFSANGAMFAKYNRDTSKPDDLPDLPAADGEHVQGDNMIMFRRIIENGEIIGTLYLRAHYQANERAWNYAGIVLVVAMLALLVSVLFSWWLQRSVSDPILAAANLARKVAERRDYSLRAKKTTQDEIGYLVDAFNDLLEEVGQRSEALEASNRKLEREITERGETQQALLDSELRHRRLVNILTSVVWSSDQNGEFSDEQQAWAQYTGQAADGYRGKGWHDVVHADDRSGFDECWAQALLGQETFECEVRVWHAASEDYRYVHMRAVPLWTENTHPQQWIGMLDDIEDRRSSEEKVRRLNAELEQRVSERTLQLETANKELEAFSYSVSHDLRTPLRAIDGFCQALLEDYAEQLDDTGNDYLARVRAAAQRMGTLIDDMIKLSRVSRADLNRATVDLSEIAQQVVVGLQQGEPGREVEVQITSGLENEGDPQLVRIALENLIQNAWKYSSKRPDARIEFGLRQINGEAGYFVQDNGAGFNMDYAGKLFGAFQRLHDERDFPGTGIGLATVQRIIHRHGGRVWAEGAVDQGATFYFTLPSH